MNRTALTLSAAITLAMLGACAPYGASDDYYGGGGGYGGGYYEPDYYGPGYNQPYVPYGAYGGGYYRDHRGGDHAYRGQDRNQGDRNQGDGAHGNGRGDRQGNIQGTQDNNRAQRQDNNQANAQANTAYRGGNTMPNGDRITRGNFWQLNQQPQQNAAPAPSSGQASDGQSGGRRGFGRGRDSN